jgi:hypothetical protein
VISFDNLSRLQDWLSDCLCRLATGGGFTTRELYTDCEEVFFDAMRPSLLTSIEDLAARGDLLERAIILRLPRISERERRTEREFWAEFEAVRPCILGALLDAVCAGLAGIDCVRLDALPRMADFATWVTAAQGALGWPAGAFLRSYAGNQQDANELALEASPLTGPLRQLADRPGGWEGTATVLLGELGTLVTEEARKRPDWPKRSNLLSGQLRRLAPNLLRVGIAIEFARGSGRTRNRTVRVSTAEPGAELSSASSAIVDPPGEAASSAGMSDVAGTGADAVWDDPCPQDPWSRDDADDADDADDGLRGFSEDTNSRGME